MKPAPYKVDPAVTWPGGKRRLAEEIIAVIPKHKCYVEPFAGGLAVLLAKPRSAVEVVNDMNGDLVTFYRCVRFHTDALLTELEFVLNSRQEFFDFRDQRGLTDIQRASRWWFRNRNCFRGACLDTFGTSASGSAAQGSREARMQQIRELSHRLDKVTVENLDWKRCLDLYDRAETVFFLDPPYTDCDAGAYDTWTIADILGVSDRVRALKGSWILTLNDHPKIRKIFGDCQITQIERARGIASGSKRYHELIITPGSRQ